jgi:hypothetical protein
MLHLLAGKTLAINCVRDSACDAVWACVHSIGGPLLRLVDGWHPAIGCEMSFRSYTYVCRTSSTCMHKLCDISSVCNQWVSRNTRHPAAWCHLSRNMSAVLVQGSPRYSIALKKLIQHCCMQLAARSPLPLGL